MSAVRVVAAAACMAMLHGLPGCCGVISPGALLDPLCGPGARSNDGASAWPAALARRLHRPFEPLAHLRVEYALEKDEAQRGRMRDEYALGVLSLIEEHHQRSSIVLAGARAGHDAAADLAVIGLTTAATLSPGGAVQAALAAAASATTGANLALDNRLLRDQGTSAILAQMDVEHADARSLVLDRLRNSNDAGYPIAAVELDLLECLYAGTPVRALASLADAAALRRADRRR